MDAIETHINDCYKDAEYRLDQLKNDVCLNTHIDFKDRFLDLKTSIVALRNAALLLKKERND